MDVDVMVESPMMSALSTSSRSISATDSTKLFTSYPFCLSIVERSTVPRRGRGILVKI